MVIKSNITAHNAWRNSNKNSLTQSKKMERLSSGYRINRAADDAVGLAVSEKMRSQIRGLNMAKQNIVDGISLIQTSEGALSETCDILQRMQELSIKSLNETTSDDDRAYLNMEFQQLKSEIDRIAVSTTFNEKILLNGKYAESVTIDIISPEYHLYGRASASAISGNPFVQTQLQNAVFDAGHVIEMNISIDGASHSALFDLAAAIKGANPGFEDFLRDNLYEADGSITTENMARIAETIQTGLKAQLELNELHMVEDDYGSQYIVVDFDKEGRLLIGFSHEDYVIENIRTYLSLAAGPNHFSSDFFLGLFGDDNVGFDSSSITYNRIASGNQDVPGAGIRLVIGPDVRQTMFIYIESMRTNDLGIADSAVDPLEKANAAIDEVVDALKKVTKQRSDFGAYQNRLEHTLKSNMNTAENLTAAESRIRDTDMAKEMVDLAQTNILNQSAAAMLSQATQIPEAVLRLLQ